MSCAGPVALTAGPYENKIRLIAEVTNPSENFPPVQILARFGRHRCSNQVLVPKASARCLKALHDSVDANVYELLAGQRTVRSDFEVDPGRFSFYK